MVRIGPFTIVGLFKGVIFHFFFFGSDFCVDVEVRQGGIAS